MLFGAPKLLGIACGWLWLFVGQIGSVWLLMLVISLRAQSGES
jgi:hypothetical protein